MNTVSVVARISVVLLIIPYLNVRRILTKNWEFERFHIFAEVFEKADVLDVLIHIAIDV